MSEHLCMIQIVASPGDGIYALDENGALWHYQPVRGWKQILMPPRPGVPGPPVQVTTAGELE